MRPDPPPSTSKVRATLALAGLCIFGAVTALAIGEVAVRLSWEPPQTPKRPVRSHQGLPILPKKVTLLASPGVEGIFRGAYFRNNSDAFRGPEYEKVPAPDVFRIAVIGDSVTMGSGVANRETYPSLLADALASRFPGQTFEVLNLGLSGLNTAQILGRGRLYVPLYHPHLIVYGMTLNDLEGPHYRNQRNPEAKRAQLARYRKYANSPSRLLRFAWPRIQNVRDMIDPPRFSYLAELRHNFFNNPEAWRDFETALAEMLRLAKRNQIPLVLFTHTTLAHLSWLHPYTSMYEQIESTAAALGIPVIQSLPAHYGRSAESLWVAPRDPHPNAEGHRVLAGALADGLAALPPEYHDRAAANARSTGRLR